MGNDDEQLSLVNQENMIYQHWMKCFMHASLDDFSSWKNECNETEFLDPSAQGKGPSTVFIRNDLLFQWLEENDLQLI